MCRDKELRQRGLVEGSQIIARNRIMSATTITKSTNDQIQRLQDQVEAMVRDTITPTLAEIVARSATTALQGSRQAREYSDTVASGVRSRPLVSVLLAGAIGFVAGRLSSGSPKVKPLLP
jgi:ElaB/YqjD/DUF883 family membrane-anchored ribosome-binding protein